MVGCRFHQGGSMIRRRNQLYIAWSGLGVRALKGVFAVQKASYYLARWLTSLCVGGVPDESQSSAYLTLTKAALFK